MALFLRRVSRFEALPSELIHQIQSELAKVSHGLAGVKGMFNLALSCKTMKEHADYDGRLKDIQQKRAIFETMSRNEVVDLAERKEPTDMQQLASKHVVDCIQKNFYRCNLNFVRLIKSPNEHIQNAAIHHFMNNFNPEVFPNYSQHLTVIFENCHKASTDEIARFICKLHDWNDRKIINFFAHPFEQVFKIQNQNLYDEIVRIKAKNIENSDPVVHMDSTLAYLGRVPAPIVCNAAAQSLIKNKSRLNFPGAEFIIETMLAEILPRADENLKQQLFKLADACMEKLGVQLTLFESPLYLQSEFPHIRQVAIEKLKNDIYNFRRELTYLNANSVASSQYDDVREASTALLQELIPKFKLKFEDLSSFAQHSDMQVRKSVLESCHKHYQISREQAYKNLNHSDSFVRKMALFTLISDLPKTLTEIQRDQQMHANQFFQNFELLLNDGVLDDRLEQFAEHCLVNDPVSETIIERLSLKYSEFQVEFKAFGNFDDLHGIKGQAQKRGEQYVIQKINTALDTDKTYFNEQFSLPMLVHILSQDYLSPEVKDKAELLLLKKARAGHYDKFLSSTSKFESLLRSNQAMTACKVMDTLLKNGIFDHKFIDASNAVYSFDNHTGFLKYIYGFVDGVQSKLGVGEIPVLGYLSVQNRALKQSIEKRFNYILIQNLNFNKASVDDQKINFDVLFKLMWDGSVNRKYPAIKNLQHGFIENYDASYLMLPQLLDKNFYEVSNEFKIGHVYRVFSDRLQGYLKNKDLNQLIDTLASPLVWQHESILIHDKAAEYVKKLMDMNLLHFDDMELILNVMPYRIQNRIGLFNHYENKQLALYKELFTLDHQYQLQKKPKIKRLFGKYVMAPFTQSKIERAAIFEANSVYVVRPLY